MSGGGQGTHRAGEFADDDDKEGMNKPGQKGGQASGGWQSSEADESTGGGQIGRGGNFADDRDKTSEAGRKGGENSGGGGRQS
ncbi:KGG domain-containing protein [Pseudomonas sp. 3296]|uniref:KGG domain-containing protein n=1 Tax=Pseudomonas sp. 3296 TaxID=2817753 RepID=UPI00286D2D5D|nr:KGG domain-containing protein [Pseudomonas sp. 3296]